MKNQREIPTCAEALLQTIEKKNPKTVKELLEFVKQDYGFSEQRIMKCLIELENEGKISLRENPKMVPSKFKDYLFSYYGAWYLAIALTVLVSATATFIIPESAFPFVYARYLLGSLFVLFLPGYCFIKVVLSSEKLDYLEKIMLSIGVSIFFVFVIGLLLNYTPWGINLIPVTLSLLFLTLVLATVGLIKEYKARLKKIRAS